MTAATMKNQVLETLLNADLPAFVGASVNLEQHRVAATRVDGNIIGTGMADFTVDNTLYTLAQGGKTFQLIDVPGIEGDERRYAGLVKAAVAKAHLVIYVNGTNKKPEKLTAEKIRSYLRRGTQVSPVLNVRGLADAYEFDEDRITLAKHGASDKALAQTTEVLRGVLGDEVLLPGHFVQGLLGFASLAWNGAESTVHPAREDDLGSQQRKYLKYFSSPQDMFAFSQLAQVGDVIRAKQATFKQDIIESNKTKVRELLAENLRALEQMRARHQAFIDKVEPEFNKCRAAVCNALATFDRILGAGRTNRWEQFFNRLNEFACKHVRDHFGDNAAITSKIDNTFKIEQQTTERSLQDHLAKHLKGLDESLAQATRRLVEDVQRVNVQQKMQAHADGATLRYAAAPLDMDLGLGDFGLIAFNIGSYAMTGATIGTGFPVVGTVIGAVVGALVGALVSVAGFFAGKEERIRKAQSQVREKLDKIRFTHMDSLAAENQQISGPVHAEVQQSILAWVEAMHAALVRPLAVLDGQIAQMKNTQQQLESMPYGTIQPIRH